MILLEPLEKMPYGILLMAGHEQSLYFLFFLYQNIFPVLSQEL